MHDAVIGLLEKADAALAESEDVVKDSDIADLRAIRDRVATRLDYPDDVLIVALAGGTGSGKSSLFNAIAGAEIAEAGGIRPTTSEAMALVSPEARSGVSAYLGRIGVKVTDAPTVPDWLCVIDTPDTDSVAEANAASAEELVAKVDAIVWVADPQKYGDASLHNKFLGSLIDYEDQFLFVLNQVDRVSVDDRASVRQDFTRTLLDTGLKAPRVFLTTAASPSGPPEGVDRLLEAIESMSEAGSPGYRKLLLDLGGVGQELIDLTEGASSIDFEARWATLSSECSSAISQGDTARASHLLSAFLEEIGDAVGGAAGQAISARAVGAPDVVTAALEQARTDYSSVEETGQPQIQTRFSGFFRRRRSEAGSEGPTVLPTYGIESVLENDVALPIRESMNNRARFHAAILDLHLSARALLEQSL